jgi:gliding motility-associatede transport system auxiliary component
MNTKVLTGGGLALAMVLLLAVNIFSQAAFRGARIDLTDNKLYTLSDGTRHVLAGLKEPVNLRLFLSLKLATDLPGISPYATRVRELLEEYRRVAGGKLTLTVIDPEPFSEDEDRAVAYGLKGVPLSDQESNFYFGLVATGPTGEELAIPFFSPDRQEFLEYDVTKLIQQATHPKPKVVGLMSSLPLEGSPRRLPEGAPMRPWMILEQIRQLFEVRLLGEEIAAIPDDVDILMLVHPKDLSDKTQYAIDQFVLRGGRALVFVDPYAEADRSPAGEAGEEQTQSIMSSRLDRLLNAWGLELEPGRVVGDLQLGQKVRFERGPQSIVADYPVWMKLTSAQINRSDIVTATLGDVVLATPGRLIVRKDATTHVTPLLETSPGAMEIDAARVRFMADPQGLLRGFRPAGEPFILAARVTGKVRSAFPDGPPDAAPDKGAAPDAKKDTNQVGKAGAEKDRKAAAGSAAGQKGYLAESKVPVNLIVVADTDLLQDRFWVQAQDLLGTRIAVPTAGNGALVVNALDSLAGSNELIGVRSRGQFTRPFTRVDKLREEAELRYREKEQQLSTRLRETERKLLELDRGKQDGNAMILSAAQQQELERFRQEKIQIRKELRQVRHDLRRNIEGLETRVKFVNIGLVPLLISAGGIAVGLYRVRRRRGRAQPPAAVP